MVVATLLGRRDVPVHVVAVRLGRHAVEVDDLHALRREPGELPVVQGCDVTGVLDQRRDVRGAVADPVRVCDDQRRLVLRDDDLAGVVGTDDAQREGALEPADDDPEDVQQVGVGATPGCQLRSDEVRDDLGVRLGHEVGIGQCGAQLLVVLDDPVVDQLDTPVR